MNTSTALMMTYGEAMVYRSETITMENGEYIAANLPNHKPRMNKEQTITYYFIKINRYWKSTEFKINKIKKNKRHISFKYNKKSKLSGRINTFWSTSKNLYLNTRTSTSQTSNIS